MVDAGVWEPTEFQRSIRGPKKLEMVRADTSGSVNADIQFIADRLAILNHLSAYSYTIDERRMDDYYSLFSDDVLFQTTVPGWGTIEVKGKQGLKILAGPRYSAMPVMRRHKLGLFHVAEQTATEAKARAYLLISIVPNADELKMLTSGTYTFTLQKREGAWTITRMYIEIDAPLEHSPMPATLPEGWRFIPDPEVTPISASATERD